MRQRRDGEDFGRREGRPEGEVEAGDTPLIAVARLWKNPDVFKALLDGGADKSARNDADKTAYDFALSGKAPAAVLDMLK
jgi:ankyrin repeat protein